MSISAISPTATAALPQAKTAPDGDSPAVERVVGYTKCRTIKRWLCTQGRKSNTTDILSHECGYSHGGTPKWRR
jgi:hypothetical protein